VNKRIFALCLLLVVATTTIFASAVFAGPTKMSSGFYYPTDRVWGSGTAKSNWTYAASDPKQPYNDGSSGGRIYGFMEPDYIKNVGSQHCGMDIRQSYNSNVYAISAGTIERYITSSDTRYNAIIVKHRMANGSYFWAVYGHCRLKSGLSTGRSVAAGEVIGYINESGNQHIHFGIKLNNNFSTGWGRLATGKDPLSIGWRPPRTWMMQNSPYGSSGGSSGGNSGGSNSGNTGGSSTPSPSDTTPPAITITGPTVGSAVPTVSWKVTDSGSGVATVTMQWNSGTAKTVAATGIAQIPSGEQKLTIRATDKAGNSASKTAGPFNVQGMVVTVPSSLFKDGFYVQTMDKSEGIRIQYGSGGGPSVSEGDVITINSSKLVTANGEQYRSNASISVVGSTSIPDPISVTVPELKKEAVDVGLLVTIKGNVSYVKSDGTAFYVDDGTGVYDGFHTGIRVLCDGFANGSKIPMPKLGSNVTVVGIYSRATVQGKIVPAIRLRYKDDITLWQQTSERINNSRWDRYRRS